MESLCLGNEQPNDNYYLFYKICIRICIQHSWMLLKTSLIQTDLINHICHFISFSSSTICSLNKVLFGLDDCMLHKCAAVVLPIFAVASAKSGQHPDRGRAGWIIPGSLDAAADWVVPSLCSSEAHWCGFLLSCVTVWRHWQLCVFKGDFMFECVLPWVCIFFPLPLWGFWAASYHIWRSSSCSRFLLSTKNLKQWQDRQFWSGIK